MGAPTEDIGMDNVKRYTAAEVRFSTQGGSFVRTEDYDFHVDLLRRELSSSEVCRKENYEGAYLLREKCEQLTADQSDLITALNEILRVTPLGSEAFGIAALVLGELGVTKEPSDDIPDFTPGSGNKSRRRAEALGIDYDAVLRKSAPTDE